MTTEIVAILAVPVEGDPGGLLAFHSELGGGPPTAILTPDGWVGSYAALRANAAKQWNGDELIELVSAPHALVLQWDGELCLDGFLRAADLAAWWFDVGGRAALHVWADLDERLRIAEELVRRGHAGRVVRLARVDGRLVEVTP